MKRFVLFALVWPGIAATAASPASLAGTVFRERGSFTHLRLGWERTILFRNETEFIHVKALTYSTVTGIWQVQSPPGEGAYVYRKTGAATGEVTFADPLLESLTLSNATGARTLALTFAPAAPGAEPDTETSRGTHDFGNPAGSFTLARLATVEGWPLSNLSLRGNVSAQTPLIAGFFLKEPGGNVVIRVIGPSLRRFGVTRAWPDPRFALYAAGRTEPIAGGPGQRHEIAYYDDWSRSATATAGLIRLFSFAGAFPLEDGSRDAVGVSPRLGAGGYTIVCAAADEDAGGEALVEVYVLP
jgi:hypothetical protein